MIYIKLFLFPNWTITASQYIIALSSFCSLTLENEDQKITEQHLHITSEKFLQLDHLI